jgi:hypothetical protein
MEGLVTSYSSTTLVISVDNIGGSGTLTDWNINVAGSVGATGPTGVTGATGATGPAGATTWAGITDKPSVVVSNTVYQIWRGSQAAYDALGTYESNALYFIEDAV